MYVISGLCFYPFEEDDDWERLYWFILVFCMLWASSSLIAENFPGLRDQMSWIRDQYKKGRIFLFYIATTAATISGLCFYPFEEDDDWERLYWFILVFCMLWASSSLIAENFPGLRDQMSWIRDQYKKGRIFLFLISPMTYFLPHLLPFLQERLL